MKKFKLFSLICIMMITLSGCKKGEPSIKVSQIETNTMLVKSDGSLQVAIIEDFEKSYYDKDELKEYVKEAIDTFNQSVNNEKAVTLKTLEKRKENVIMVLNYQNFDYYAKFNEVEAYYYDGISNDVLNQLPDTLQCITEGESIEKGQMESIDQKKVIIVNEEYNLIIRGKIKYYSNGTIVNSKEIQTVPEGTIVIYE